MAILARAAQVAVGARAQREAQARGSTGLSRGRRHGSHAERYFKYLFI